MADPANPLTLMALALALMVLPALAAPWLKPFSLAAVYPVCVVAAALASAVDLAVLFAGTATTAHLPIGLPNIGLRFRIDELSAFFGLTVNVGVMAASLYGLGLDRQKDLSPRIEPYFPAFAAAMNVVLLADDAFGFLFFWELMSLTSWALVLARHTDEDARRAAHVYLVMASIGTVALFFAFGALACQQAAMILRRCERHRCNRRQQHLCYSRFSPEPAPRPALCRCMPGCRSRIRRRQVMSPRL